MNLNLTIIFMRMLVEVKGMNKIILKKSDESKKDRL